MLERQANALPNNYSLLETFIVKKTNQNGNFHVLAPGRSYSLYYLFQIAESEVLSKQAHLSILCHIPIKGSYPKLT